MNVAHMAGISDEVIERAKEMTQDFEGKHGVKRAALSSLTPGQEGRLLLPLPDSGCQPGPNLPRKHPQYLAFTAAEDHYSCVKKPSPTLFSLSPVQNCEANRYHDPAPCPYTLQQKPQTVPREGDAMNGTAWETDVTDCFVCFSSFLLVFPIVRPTASLPRK